LEPKGLKKKTLRIAENGNQNWTQLDEKRYRNQKQQLTF